MRLKKSFRFAIRGIVFCINQERNMRIHTVAALYVFAFSFFFHFSDAEFAVLFLTFAAVMMGELFNTAAEALCGELKPGYSPAVRAVKDISAGAVLTGAFFAVCVAVCLFRRPEGFALAAGFFRERPLLLLPLAAFTAVCIVYIAAGPAGIRDYCRRRFGGKGKHRESE